MPTQTDNSIINAAALWDLDVRGVRKDIEICGSPERCEFRCVIECSDDKLYVIERLNEEEIRLKQRIISSLNYLSDQGLAGINPYTASPSGDYVVKYNNKFWQISRFVSGTPLKRPEYVFDQWRGNILADFLIDLRRKASAMPGFENKSPFSIVAFIDTLSRQIKMYEPALQKEILPIVDFLQKDFIKTHDMLPSCFCHGDFHALNVIWSDIGINAVIDWEFSGIKPDIYDAANMIGCIGIENPDALAGPLAADFVRRLRQAAIISDQSWRILPEFIVAIRFAWLSEWLRHSDHEMIDLEMVYMNLLINNANDLKQIWGI